MILGKKQEDFLTSSILTVKDLENLIEQIKQAHPHAESDEIYITFDSYNECIETESDICA